MVPLMSESLDRRLDVLEYLKLRLHLIVCAWCARYLKQIKFLRRLFRERTFAAVLDKASPVALPAGARERIGRSLLKDQESCSGTQAADRSED
jgi:hypothetical protein